MNKFKFISVSKNEKTLLDKKDFESIQNSEFIQILNNKNKLTAVYNQYLDETRKNKDSDFIVFIHGDAKVDVKHLINHILECQNKYDVMGLCGTEVIFIDQSPLNWFTGSIPKKEKRWGCVTHGESNSTSFFNVNHNILDHEVICIDGVCIIFGPNAINNDLKFDEQFSFDFYDTDISFQCILNKNLKLGVLVEESLYHYSVGKQILSKNFLESEKIFRQKFPLTKQN